METLTRVPVTFTEVPAPNYEIKEFVEPWDKGFTPQKDLAKKYKGSGDPVGTTKDTPRSADDRHSEISSLALAALASIQAHSKRIGNE